MTYSDELSVRLRDLAELAPTPVADPGADIRRGRLALRRRRARRGAAVSTTLLAVGAFALALPSLIHADGAHRTGATNGTGRLGPAGAPSTHSFNLCPASQRPLTLTWPPDPHIAIIVTSYRNAAGRVLDPTGKHLDVKGPISNVLGGTECLPTEGNQVVELGTTIGWKSGPALGSVSLDVMSPLQSSQSPQIVMDHPGWAAYRGPLPADVASARTAIYPGGKAVVVKRRDGFVVAVAADGVWGNNEAPGTAAVTDLPTISKLLALAASPQLTIPTN